MTSHKKSSVTHHTAAEIIYNRADSEQPHMGLTTWKKAPNGRVQKSDTIVAKNYLSDTELDQLNRISTLPRLVLNGTSSQQWKTGANVLPNFSL